MRRKPTFRRLHHQLQDDWLVLVAQPLTADTGRADREPLCRSRQRRCSLLFDAGNVLRSRINIAWTDKNVIAAWMRSGHRRIYHDHRQLTSTRVIWRTPILLSVGSQPSNLKWQSRGTPESTKTSSTPKPAQHATNEGAERWHRSRLHRLRLVGRNVTFRRGRCRLVGGQRFRAVGPALRSTRWIECSERRQNPTAIAVFAIGEDAGQREAAFTNQFLLSRRFASAHHRGHIPMVDLRLGVGRLQLGLLELDAPYVHA